MNKWRLHFSVTLYPDHSGNYTVMENLDVKDLSFFQVCVILGALQCLADEARAENEARS